MISYFQCTEEKDSSYMLFQFYNNFKDLHEGSNPLIKINIEALTPFNVDSQTLENISNYLSNSTFKEKTFIHKKQSQLPFSLSINPIDQKVFLKTKGLPPVGFGSSCNLVFGVDLQTHVKVAYRSLPTHKVTLAERNINIELSERPDLFVATKEIYDYEGSFTCKVQKDESEKEIVVKSVNRKKIPKTCFILECLNMDLFDLLDSNLNFQDKIDIACDIAKALDVLHNNYNVVHRDLKLENIFISECSGYQKYHAKIGDFGQSEYMGQEPVFGGGTSTYNPPEWLLRAIKNEKNRTDDLPRAEFSSDMWSFGVTLLLLFGGPLTYEYWDDLCETYDYISSDFPLYKEDAISTMESNEDERLDSIIELIRFCLEFNPNARITAHKARKILEDLKDTSGCTVF